MPSPSVGDAAHIRRGEAREWGRTGILQGPSSGSPMCRTGPDTNGARATEAGEASDTGARAPVDLTDLDLFAEGLPHEIFEELRRQKPVFFHEPTERTPGGRRLGTRSPSDSRC